MLLTIFSGWLYVEKRRLLQVFPEGVRRLWDDWELRVMVLVSLTLQIWLIFAGNRRKYKPGTWLRISIWSSYLMADWVATVALGVLSNKQGHFCSCDAKKHNSISEELMAFWAPFLLLHLGGPDTITAYALADNELWLRHLLGLGVQTSVALYVTLTAWRGTWLSFLTITMIFSGVIKYGERSLALRSANREQFLDSLLDPPDAGPSYSKFMEEFYLKQEEGFTVLAIEVIEVAEQSYAGSGDNNGAANTRKLLPDAYSFFQTFKRLFVDLILSFQDRDKSQSYFQNSSWEAAFNLVQIELGFGYDAFYTKAPIIYNKWGCFCRFITSSFTIMVFVFFLNIEKHNHRQIDLIITYILLVGAILLEFYAVILLLSSDRTKLWLSEHEFRFPRKIDCFQPMVSRIISCFQLIISRVISCFELVVSRMISCFQPIISRVISCYSKPMVSRITSYFRPVICPVISCFQLIICRLVSSFLPSKEQRWSNSMAQYNLLSFSLKDKPVPCLDDKPDLFQKIVKRSPIYKTFENRWYKFRCKISNELKELIFQHFLEKSKVNNKEKAEYDKHIASFCSARGSGVFKEAKYGCDSSFDWTTEVEFDQSILIWHIATDLCYHSDGGKDFAAKNPTCQGSKNLSDYMLYLLVMCPFMLPIGIGMIRFRDTCDEAKEFSKDKGLSSTEKEELQNMLLEVSTEVPPTKVKGDRSKSVLFDACRLAHLLQKMETEKWNKEKKWEFVCNVWIEILGYAASHCRGYYHAQQLSMGGELLTHVWLLMAHLGITEQFQINRGHARAKLAVY